MLVHHYHLFHNLLSLRFTSSGLYKLKYVTIESKKQTSEGSLKASFLHGVPILSLGYLLWYM